MEKLETRIERRYEDEVFVDLGRLGDNEIVVEERKRLGRAELVEFAPVRHVWSREPLHVLQQNRIFVEVI